MATLSSRFSANSPSAATRFSSTQPVLCSSTPAQYGQTGSSLCKGRNMRGHRCFQGRKEHYRHSLLIPHAANMEVVESSAALEEGLIEMEVKVDGMTCGHCTSRVEDALAALPGVLSATASLETGIVTVTAAADDQLQAAAVQLPAVVQAIEGLGFAAEPYFPQEEVPKTAE